MTQPVELHGRWLIVKSLVERRDYTAAVAAGDEAWRERDSFGGNLVGRLALDYALALGKTGEYPRAIAVLEETLQRPDVPHRLQIGLLENLGHWYAKAGHVDDGLAYLSKAREMAAGLTDPADQWHVGRLDYLLGRWLLEARLVEQALSHLEGARQVLDPLDNEWSRWAQVYHGRALLAAGQVDEAQALGIKNACGDDEVAVEALTLLAMVAHEKGNLTQQQERARAAMNLAKRVGRDDLFRQAARIL